MVNDRGWLKLLVDLHGKPFAIIAQALETSAEVLPQVKQVALAWYREHIREEKVEAILYIEAADDAPEEIARTQSDAYCYAHSSSSLARQPGLPTNIKARRTGCCRCLKVFFA